MAQSLAKILVHTVFSTKERRPFLHDVVFRAETHRYVGGILRDLDCLPILVNGMSDHVHILSTLSRTRSPADVIKEVKRGSTIWVKSKNPALADFAWQNGYGIFSAGFSQIEAVKAYIANQDEHHKTMSFQDEFKLLLQRYDVEYDERYVWD